MAALSNLAYNTTKATSLVKKSFYFPCATASHEERIVLKVFCAQFNFLMEWPWFVCKVKPELFNLQAEINDNFIIRTFTSAFGITRKAEVMLTQLRLGFSDLNTHIYVKGCINSPFCNCGISAKTIKHFFLKCPKYSNIRQILFNSVSNTTSLPITANLFLFGDESVPTDINCDIIIQVF